MNKILLIIIKLVKMRRLRTMSDGDAVKIMVFSTERIGVRRVPKEYNLN